MVHQTRFRIGILAVLLVSLVVTGYFIVRPLFLSERSIRIALTEHVKQWTGGTFTVSGPVRLSYFPRLQLELNKVRMDGIKNIPALREIQADRIDIRLGLGSLISDDPVVDRFTLVDPVIRAHSAPVAKDAEKSPSASSAVVALSRAPFDQIVIENGRILISGPQMKEELSKIDGKINLSDPEGVFSSRGSFTWREQELTFYHESGSAEKTGNAIRIPIEVSIEGGLLRTDVDGMATLGKGLKIDGDVDLQIPDLPMFAKWTGVLLPDDIHGGAFAVNGTFHWAGHRIGFDEGTFALDGNRALGAVALEFGGPRPQIEGTLALQRLDLTRYLQPDTAEQKTEGAKSDRRRAKPVQMDFPLLHHINLDLRISTTELTAGRLSIGQSALSVVLSSGRLAADIAVFDICGGNGNGRLEFDATVPDSKIRLTTSLSNVLAESCVGLFAKQSPVKGPANVTADLTSNGRVANDLIAGLNGKVTIEIAQGQMSFDAVQLLANLREGPLKGWQAVNRDEVEFSELTGTLLFRRGEIYTDSLQVALAPDILRTEGKVGLANHSLDLRLEIAKLVEAQTEDKGQPDTKLVGAIVIKGPWSEPIFRLEPAKSNAHLIAPRNAAWAAWIGSHH
ncbi:MAG: AsmA family protein [Hyphomicrobiaceae bacterium]|nr:AsmA family protein [Hyphomicrobiaceae bacterium]